jgi:hypothetical protein
VVNTQLYRQLQLYSLRDVDPNSNIITKYFLEESYYNVISFNGKLESYSEIEHEH